MEKRQAWSDLGEGDLCNSAAAIRRKVAAPGNGSQDTHARTAQRWPVGFPTVNGGPCAPEVLRSCPPHPLLRLSTHSPRLELLTKAAHAPRHLIHPSAAAVSASFMDAQPSQDPA